MEALLTNYTSNRLDLVHALLTDDIDLTSKDNKGNTALMIAKSKGYKEIETLLYAHATKLKNREKKQNDV